MSATKSPRLFPFLWYATDAEKAARFYVSIFPDSRVSCVTALPHESPGGPPGSIKVVDFTLMGQRVQAMGAEKHHPFNDAMSIVVLARDQRELDRWWKGLLRGGGKAIACGWLKDRYGVRWQVVPEVLVTMYRSRERARARRVLEALQGMVKVDIAALKKAWRG